MDNDRKAWTAPKLKHADASATAVGATYDLSDGQFAGASSPLPSQNCFTLPSTKWIGPATLCRWHMSEEDR